MGVPRSELRAEFSKVANIDGEMSTQTQKRVSAPEEL